MTSQFDDIFGKGPFGDGRVPRQPSPKKVEKGLPWHAKKIDGRLYLPLEQVIELLKINSVLPGVRKGLEKHL